MFLNKKYSYIFRKSTTFAKIEKSGNKVFLYPEQSCRTFVQGTEISHKVQLDHNNCIIFGFDKIYVFNDPTKKDDLCNHEETELYNQISKSNYISGKMEKGVCYEHIMVPPEILGIRYHNKEVHEKKFEKYLMLNKI